MDWIGSYERFNQSEKLQFQRIVNRLQGTTFLLRDVYDNQEQYGKVHRDYRFVDRHFDVFTGYLELGGWTLWRDTTYGVIHLGSAYEYNKVQFNKFTTLILLTLRLLFEERREEISLRNEVVIATYEVVEKLMNLNLIDKRPAFKDLSESLRILGNYHIITRLEKGKWEAPDTKLMILPSILFILPNEGISKLKDLLEEPDPKGEQNEEEEAEDDLEEEEETLEEETETLEEEGRWEDMQ
jgi:hypothetical protein